MRAQNLDDSAMAERVGGIMAHGIRKLKYGERGPSIEVAIRIDEVTSGEVGLRDWAVPEEERAQRRPAKKAEAA